MFVVENNSLNQVHHLLVNTVIILNKVGLMVHQAKI